MDEFATDTQKYSSHQQYAVQSQHNSGRCLVVGSHLNSDTYTLTATKVFKKGNNGE